MSRGDDFDYPTDRPPSNGVATAALVLGILGQCFGPLAGIPAIVCGIFGVNRAGRVNGRGQGPAIAGLVLGGIGTLFPVAPAILIALLLPAVQKVRQAAISAHQTHDMNNFKQTGLAVINHEFTTKRLLPAYALGSDHEPNRGLAWRVDLLPYLDQEPLYKQFNLDEAWNGPANRGPAQTFVSAFGSVADPQDNQTRIRVFVGPGTLFEDTPAWRQRASIGRIRDGASNTLLAVETADRVPWASPQDLPYQPGGPLPALGHPSRNVVLIVMADGSVRALKKPINPTILHALITRDGREALPVNWDQ